MFSLRKFRHYVISGPFVVNSDHEALRSAFKKNDIHGRLTRWLNLMDEYDLEILHMQGN